MPVSPEMQSPGENLQTSAGRERARVSSMPPFDEFGLSPSESLEYEGMGPKDIVAKELEKGNIGSIPKNFLIGDETFLEGLKHTYGVKLGEPIQWSPQETSRRIQAFLDGTKAIKGQKDMKGTLEDAVRSLRENFKMRTAPLEQKRAEILAEMFGPQNAETLIAIKDINPNQGAIALGAAMGALIRGEDINNVVEALAMPVRAQIEKRKLGRELRMKQLGLEYEQAGEEIGFEQKLFGDEVNAAQAQAIEEERTFRETEKQREITDRDDKRQDEMMSRQAAAALGSIDDSKDPALALSLWENAYAKFASPETKALALKLSERYGRAAETKIALDKANQTIKEETGKRLKLGFEDWQKQNKSLTAKLGWDARRSEVAFKEAAKNLEYLDREKALGVMKDRLEITRVKEAMELARQGNRREWQRYWFGSYSDQMRVSDQESDRAMKAFESEWDQFMQIQTAKDKLIEQIATGKAAQEDTTKLEEMLKTFEDIKMPVPKRPEFTAPMPRQGGGYVPVLPKGPIGYGFQNQRGGR